MPPLISVLCPLYNHQAYIAKTLASVQQQTFTDWELIVVDDASTDASATVVEGFVDSRIKLIKQQHNQGISQTLATAYQQASGAIIAMVGSDDVFAPHKLATQLDYLNQHGGVVFSQARVIDQNDRVTDQFFGPEPQPLDRAERLRDLFFKGNTLCGSSILLHRKHLDELTQPFNPLYLQLEDFDRNIKLALNTLITVLPEALVDYRKHDANISQRNTFSAIRTRWEMGQILQDVAHQMTLTDAVATFADYVVNRQGQAISQPLQADVPFILAMAAIHSGKHPHLKLFGLQTLFNCLKHPGQKHRLETVYGFTLADYHQLTGLFDFYEYEKNRPVALPVSSIKLGLSRRYTAEFRLMKTTAPKDKPQ